MRTKKINPYFWKCVCEGSNSIHAKAHELHCHKCRARQEDSPDVEEEDLQKLMEHTRSTHYIWVNLDDDPGFGGSVSKYQDNYDYIIYDKCFENMQEAIRGEHLAGKYTALALLWCILDMFFKEIVDGASLKNLISEKMLKTFKNKLGGLLQDVGKIKVRIHAKCQKENE